MVILITQQKRFPLTHLIETYFVKKYRLKHVALENFISANRAARILQIPQHELLSYAADSPEFHGVLINKQKFLFHPEPFMKLVPKKMAELIDNELLHSAVK